MMLPRLRFVASFAAAAFAAVVALVPLSAQAGAQAEEQLAPAVATLMSRAISDQPAPARYTARPELRAWVDEMSRRLAARMPDARERDDFLSTVHYEATRAGLDPQLVLGVIQTESAFHKYALSIAGARGYMQVMPFWTKSIGTPEHNLFHLRTNLRYGCVILRHYLDIESGDVFRALGRYNGSLGQVDYPMAVVGAMNRSWLYAPVLTTSTALGAAAAPTVTR